MACACSFPAFEALLEQIGVDRELGGPIEEFEGSVFAVERKRALDAAASSVGAIEQYGAPHPSVCALRRMPIAIHAGDFIKLQPAMCNLARTGQTHPIRRRPPLRIKPSREPAIGLQRRCQSVRRPPRGRQQLSVIAEPIALDDAPERIAQRMGERPSRVAEAAIGKPAICSLAGQRPAEIGEGCFAVTCPRNDPIRFDEPPGDMRVVGFSPARAKGEP